MTTKKFQRYLSLFFSFDFLLGWPTHEWSLYQLVLWLKMVRLYCFVFCLLESISSFRRADASIVNCRSQFMLLRPPFFSWAVDSFIILEKSLGDNNELMSYLDINWTLTRKTTCLLWIVRAVISSGVIRILVCTTSQWRSSLNFMDAKIRFMNT